MKQGEKKGLFVSFEGIDGSGKSSAMKRVGEILSARGLPVFSVREPGGVPIAEAIRSIIMDNENVDMDARCEALLFASARAQLVRSKIVPVLERPSVLLSDRYVDSSLVYQGFARGLGMEGVKAINEFAIDGLWPDVTYWIQIAPADAQKRIRRDEGHEENRLDVEQMRFHERVAEGYRKLLDLFPERIVPVDGYREFEGEARSIAEDIEKRWKEKSFLSDNLALPRF